MCRVEEPGEEADTGEVAGAAAGPVAGRALPPGELGITLGTLGTCTRSIELRS